MKKKGSVPTQVKITFICNQLYHNQPNINPFALRKAKIVYNFGLYECNRVKMAVNYQSYKTKQYVSQSYETI